MPLYIIVIIFFIGIVIFKLKGKSSLGIMQMSLWLTISYTFLILTHVFSGISYHSGKVLRILPYFLLCLALLIIGDYLGKKIKTRTDKKVFKININTLALTSIVGSILLISDIFRLNSISFGTRIEDFQISTIGVIGNILSSIGVVVWLKSLYEYRIYGNRISLLSYLSVLSYVSGGILSAGRQAIIIIAISTVIMLIWSNGKKKELEANSLNDTIILKRRKPIGLILILTIFISYFMLISFVRSGIFNINSKMNMLEREFNAKISDQTIKDVNQLKPLSDIYIESLFYYSHELRRLDLIYQYYDYYPLLGLSQLSYVERRVQWLLGKQGDISWNKVEVAIEQKGHFSSHTWGTFITNYIVDFGRFGTLVMCFLSGFIMGILYKSLKDKETPEKIIRHCILLAGIVFSIQYSPLAELIWTFPLIFISFIKIKTQCSNEEHKMITQNS